MAFSVVSWLLEEDRFDDADFFRDFDLFRDPELFLFCDFERFRDDDRFRPFDVDLLRDTARFFFRDDERCRGVEEFRLLESELLDRDALRDLDTFLDLDFFCLRSTDFLRFADRPRERERFRFRGADRFECFLEAEECREEERDGSFGIGSVCSTERSRTHPVAQDPAALSATSGVSTLWPRSTLWLSHFTKLSQYSRTNHASGSRSSLLPHITPINALLASYHCTPSSATMPPVPNPLEM